MRPFTKGLPRGVWLLGLVLLGCGASDAEPGVSQAELVGAPIAVGGRWSRESPDGLLEGVLELHEGCVYVATTANPGLASRRVLPVFPRETEWDAATSTLRTVDGPLFQVGDRVWFGGGEPGLRVAEYVPTGCAGAGDSFHAARASYPLER